MVVVGGQGAVQLRRHERHHVMRAEHAGFMGASRMDVRHTRTTQRNAWNGCCCCCCRRLFVFFFPPLYFGTREKRLIGDGGEKRVCSGEEEEWAVKSAKKQDMEGCVSFEGGVKATHRNGIL